MPIKGQIHLVRCAGENRWDDIPELFDPRTTTEAELQWLRLLLSSSFGIRDTAHENPLSPGGGDHLYDKLDRRLSDEEKNMTVQELCSSLYVKLEPMRSLLASAPDRKPCSTPGEFNAAHNV